MRYNDVKYKYIIDYQLELAVTTATDSLCTIKGDNFLNSTS